MRFLLALLSLPALHAAMITGMGPVTGSGTGALNSVSTPAVNNDNVLTSPNTLNFSLAVNGIGPIFHPLAATPSGGVTEYAVTMNVVNNLGVAITGWVLQLPGDPYDFDAVTGNNFAGFDSATGTSLGWTKSTHFGMLLIFNGGTPLAPGQSMTFNFAMDVPDPGAGGFGGFISTPVAALPEPASGVLIATALLGLGAWGRRRSE